MGNGLSRKFYTAAALAAVLGFALSLAAPARAATQIRDTRQFVPGEVIVKLKDGVRTVGTQAIYIRALEAALGFGKIQLVRPFITDARLTKIRLANVGDVSRAMSVLAALPEVKFVEPNAIYRALDDGAPNDADFAKLWGLRNLGQTDADGQLGHAGSDIDVLPLWQQGVTGSAKTLVAVIDTGVNWTHPDLAANIFTNPKEAGAQGADKIDNDGNGFVDDIHGWNFAGKNNNSNDDHRHGSHCSGTIGAIGNNGIGVAGIAWNVSILPVKFLDASGGGTMEDAVEAVNYARLMKAKIMSNSWGGGMFSQGLQEAIEATRDANVLFLAAAGNDSMNNDTTMTYPAGFPIDNIVAVAATDNQDNLAPFSNFGQRTVHVAAPGVKIYSTTLKNRTTGEYQYEYLSGTSMATPHVAGIAALLYSQEPNLSYTDAKNRLIRTSEPVRALRRKVVAGGRVNAYNAIHGIVPPNPDPAEELWRDQPYALESAHPYAKNTDQTFTVTSPGAKYLRVVFDKVDTETRYDKIQVIAPDGEVLDEVTGLAENVVTDYVKGDSVTLKWKSDGSVEKWGFKISKIQVINNPTLDEVASR